MVKGDILIDDDSKWKNWGGEFIKFSPDKHPIQQWMNIVDDLLTNNMREDLEWLLNENLT